MSLSGLKDVDREILKHVDDKDLLKICSLNRKTWNEICDDDFIKRRLWSKYPGIEKYKKRNESWKQFFLSAMYYISKMKEEHKFQYTSGDFQKQYYLLNSYDQSLLLIKAATAGELPIVKFAIEKGVDVNIDEDLAFRTASQFGHLDIVTFLFNKGVNIHADKDAALRHATFHCHIDVIKYLIEHGANIHVNKGEVRKIALRRCPEIVKYLNSIKFYLHIKNF